MNRIKTKLLMLVFACISAFSTFAVADLGTITNDKIYQGSGDGYIIVNGITGNDPILVTANSSNNSILSVTSINYTSPQKVAIINIKEFGVAGTVTLSVAVSDGGAPTVKQFSVTVGDFYQMGCILGIYNIAFWDHNIPNQNDNPLKELILPTSRNTFVDDENGPYKGIGLSQNPPSPPKYAIGIKQRIRGYFTPTVTGYYLFEAKSGQGILFELYTGLVISPDFVKNSSRKEINKRRDEKSSFVTTLLGGATYGFMASSHNYDNVDFSVWYGYVGTSAPAKDSILLDLNTSVGFNDYQYNVGYYTPTVRGINMQLMEGKMLRTYSDYKKPLLKNNLILYRRNNNSISLKWNKSTDPDELTNSGVKSYNIYLDGVLIHSTINERDTVYTIQNLSGNTPYTTFYTAIDMAGNESLPSNIIGVTTSGFDMNAPTPPTNFTMVQLGDVSARVSWSGASDNLNDIFGYNVYLNGSSIPLNTTTTSINNTITTLKILAPRSINTYIVKAVDGSGNESVASSVQTFTSLGFNAAIPSPDAKKMSALLTTDYIGRSEGLGLNGPAFNRNEYVGNVLNIVKELKPSMLRWGTLNANAHSFDSKSGAGVKNTPESASYAEFINFASSVDAFAEISIGTDNSSGFDGPATDWRIAPEATMRKFIGYLQGTAVIPGGDADYNAGVRKRLEEGITVPPVLNPKLKGIYIELGCEPWGGTNFGGQGDHRADNFDNYKVYGEWARSLATAAKAVPGFDSTKIKIYYSGREPQLVESGSLHQDLLGTNKSDVVDGLTLGGYLGGNMDLVKGVDFGRSEIDYFKNGIERFSKNLDGLLSTMILDLAPRAQIPQGAAKAQRMRPTLLYEADFSTTSYNKRYGQALVAMDYYLSSFSYGMTFPCLFALGDSQWGFTELGVKMPRHYFMTFLNRFIKSNVLDVKTASIEKITNSKGTVINTKPASINAYHKDGNYVVVMISRDFDNDFEVELEIPSNILPSQVNGKKYVTSSPSPGSKIFNLDSTNIVVSNKMMVTIPKYGMVLITFAGTTINKKPLAIGYANFRKPTSFDVDYASIENGGKNITSWLDMMKFNVSLIPSIQSGSRFKWDVIKSTPTQELSLIQESPLSFSVQALGCKSEGMVTVVGTMFDDPNFTFTKTFNISGQNNEDGSPCTSTSVNKSINNVSLPFKVSPVPSTGVVHLQSGIIGNIVVYSAQGQVVFTTPVTNISEKFTINLESGLYYAKLNSNLGTTTRKIVITK